MFKNAIRAILFVFVLNLTGFGQGRQMETKRLTKTPVIDGYLNTFEWLQGDSQTVFIQMEPDKGRPVTDKTIIYSGFDDNFNHHLLHFCE